MIVGVTSREIPRRVNIEFDITCVSLHVSASETRLTLPLFLHSSPEWNGILNRYLPNKQMNVFAFIYIKINNYMNNVFLVFTKNILILLSLMYVLQ